MKIKHRLWQLTVLFMMTVLCVLHAADVSQDDVLNAARKWIADNAIFQAEQPDAAPAKAVQLTDGDGKAMPLWRVDLAPSGYLVMSADDTLPPVVAFNTKGSFETPAGHPLPGMLKRQGEIFKTELEKPKTRGNELAAENQTRWNILLKRTRADSVTPSTIVRSPMLTTEWEQDAPYNYFCPNVDPYYRVVAGCVPVALAQLLKYHEWPVSCEYTKAFTDNEGDIRASMWVDGLLFPYNWSVMENSYGGKDERDYGIAEYAVARLIMELGGFVEADYESDNTLAYVHNLHTLLMNRLGFGGNSIQYGDTRNGYTGYVSQATLYSRIRTDMTAGRPALVSFEGHTFVADGLGTMGGQDYYHFNYGWGGYLDGWYLLTDGYWETVIVSATTNILPQPVPVFLPMSCEQSSTFTLLWRFPKRITAEGFRLKKTTAAQTTEVISSSISGATRSYTLSGQSGTATYTLEAKVNGSWQAASDGVTVTVKTNPAAKLALTTDEILESVGGTPVTTTIAANNTLASLAVRSSRPDILSPNGISISGSGKSRTVTLTPANGMVGNMLLYVRAEDTAGNTGRQIIPLLVKVDDSLTWHTDMEEAFEAALESGRLVLLVAGRDNCQNTNYFRNTVCETADIKAKLQSDYELWYANVDNSSEFWQYVDDQNGELPFIAIIDPAQQGVRLRAHGGFMSIDEGRLFLDPYAPYFSLDDRTPFVKGTTQSLELSVLKDDVEIRYLLGFDDPMPSSPRYSSPISLTSTRTISARSFLDGEPVSDTVTKTYTFLDQVATPRLYNDGKKDNDYFQGSCLVRAMCATAGATIRYTTDGSIPTENSPVFPDEGLTVTEYTSIIAMAFHDDMIASEYVFKSLIPLELYPEAQSVATEGHVTMLKIGASAPQYMNTPWILQTATAHSSPSAMQSGNIDDNASTVLAAKVIGPGTLSFWWKVSSEQNYDTLTFSIDGVEQDGIDGNVDWARKEYTIIGSGEHFLTWTYAKDVSMSHNGDCGWVDDIIWETNPVIERIEIDGPNHIETAKTAQYTCTAYWSDGSTTRVTPVWSLTPPAYVSIDEAGVVTNENSTTADKGVTVVAVYTLDGTAFESSFDIILERKKPVRLEIYGPDIIPVDSTVTYRCRVYWSYGPVYTASSPTWSLDSNYASIDAEGVLTNLNTTATRQVVQLNVSHTVENETLRSSKSITLEAKAGGVPTFQTLSLQSGWNWVSFYLLPSSHMVGDVLGTAGFTANDIIQTDGDSARFTGDHWVMGDFSVGFGKMYQIYVDKAVTVEISGNASGQSTVPLRSGWNWIGNPTTASVLLADLVHSGGWTSGDRIQTAGGDAAFYTANAKWLPTDFTVKSGKGYQIYSANAGTLTFPTGDADDTLYAVVDLSGGPNAASYPVRYSSIGPDLNDDTCRTTELWLRKIPAGTFVMGSPEDEEGCFAGSEMQHQVTLTQDYYIGVFECTQRQWELVMGSNPSSYKGDGRPVEQVSYDMIRGVGKHAGAGWPTYGHAVDTGSFMGILQAKTRLVFDLPTDAQWEYACRAGTTTALNSGKNLTTNSQVPNMDEVGRYVSNQSDGRGGYSQHTKVGSYQPNAWGLYDMHGNVFEWCLDWLVDDLGTAAVVDPVGPSTGSFRVIRGGGWDTGSRNCRSANRAGNNTYADYRNNHGFRVACYPQQDLYAVVDLSGGPNATSYPVRYTNTEPNLDDDTCRTTELWLRKIPAGTFVMGSPEDEVGRSNTETQHRVMLTQDYYIGVFECTQKQWELVMGSNPSKYKGDCRPVEMVSDDMIRGTGAQAGAGWPTYGHEVDASSFMGKLQAKTGLVFDLPTEAQWERACRAGTMTALNSGKNLINASSADANMAEVGRYFYNQSDGKGGYSEHTKVGSYLRNAWGLYDMHGNVGEWCLDWSGSHETAAVPDPGGPTSGTYRVLRGGSWYYIANICRSAYCYSFYPAYDNENSGFRVACLP